MPHHRLCAVLAGALLCLLPLALRPAWAAATCSETAACGLAGTPSGLEVSLDGSFARSSLITLGSPGATPERQLQIEWTAGAGTGLCRLTRLDDSNPTVEILGLANDQLAALRTRIGAVVGLDAAVTGSYCLDELVTFR